MKDDFLIPAENVSKEDLDGLVKKGLIEYIGIDPLGRLIYCNTELGNSVADELEKEDMLFKPEYDDETEELDIDELDFGLDEEDLEDEDERDDMEDY